MVLNMKSDLNLEDLVLPECIYQERKEESGESMTKENCLDQVISNQENSRFDSRVWAEGCPIPLYICKMAPWR